MCRQAALVALAVLVVFPATLSGQDTAGFYQQNCAACHTIGAGPQGGPDLKGVSDRRDRHWLEQFLVDPAAFTKDPAVIRMIAEADGMEMPRIDGVTPQRARSLIEYIDHQSGSAAAGPEEPPDAASPELGIALFTGHSTLSARGPSCGACHHVAGLPSPGGGSLGPDLTAAPQRLGGTRGLAAWLTGTPTPVMKAIYHDHPLTVVEAHSIAAFVDASAVPGAARSVTRALALSGSGVAGAVVAVIAFAGRKRFRAVRRPLVTRGPVRVTGRRAPGEHATSGSHLVRGESR